MPSILPRSKVLVTDANGNLGLWIVKTLLERGYSVRAAVCKGRGERMKPLPFNSYANCRRLETVYVQDITKAKAS
jgi:nucleoside-diphosphate-sugar epimerase